MKLFDTFLFRDELDMLECRLVQDSPVYRHILVEAAVDHRGNPKPLVFAENRERFAPWQDRIVHVVAGELPLMTDAAPLEREAVQRDAIGRGLDAGGAEPGDWMILADIDEIPNGEAIRLAAERQTGILEMTCCLFAVDWVLGPLRTSPVCSVNLVRTMYPSAVRRAGWEWPRFGGTGHHLSWLGGQAAIAAKAASHCHAECDADLLAGNADDGLYRRGVSPFGVLGHAGPLTPVDVDETWPRYVYERRCPPGWFRPRPESEGGS